MGLLMYQPTQKCVPLSRHQPKRSGKMARCGWSWSLAEAQGDCRYRTSSRSLLAQHHTHVKTLLTNSQPLCVCVIV
ncbi:hypothetical protein JOQ06_008689 [Pogonophryne albipinna]|uniref:Uncharacterized protein n=1 Tax=Pogonophryne albipinna TaxID=1090488 RepID=A0AAD6F9M3_9TELE|nr:hypothetical protein JOQ06_008689 [Pogonophryne albipinna]